ncbi:DUF4386 domain-containing protein [Demequina sediminicola]|uniref:DUF4386 domain-containing protein n=1 Tax=Demequina sediminicola TaxID=1095026 RepID=UPI0007835231|nr:DUF4386 domain-containing protein [Demequina sediminicola]
MTAADTVRTARATGLAYLGLAITGMVGFLAIRPQLFTKSPTETLNNLADNPHLAAAAIGLEMGIVITQALAAVWFYKLLREIRPGAAFATATFGLMNAAAIMTSAMFNATAVAVAGDPTIIRALDSAGVVGTLAYLSHAAWGMGAIFFGLWLIPMGWTAITTRRFPVTLGWFLIAGGIGYVLSALVEWGVADAPAWIAESLPLPATVGELWMIGYLLTVGIRPTQAAHTEAPAADPAQNQELATSGHQS